MRFAQLRRAEVSEEAVAQVFVECSAMIEDALNERFEVFVQDRHRLAGLARFGDGREAAHVDEEDGDLTSVLDACTLRGDRSCDGRREIPRELVGREA